MNRGKLKPAIRCAPFLWEGKLQCEPLVARKLLLHVLNTEMSEVEGVLDSLQCEGLLRSLCVESCLLVGGRSEALYASTRDALSQGEKGGALWRERVFLAGFAARRLGFEDESRKFWRELKASARRLSSSYQTRFEMEDAVALMNRGFFKQALDVFNALLPEIETFDLYFACRLLQCHAIVCDGLGLQKKADKSLELEGELLTQFDSRPLKTNLKRVRILNEIKREHHAHASSLLKEAFRERDASQSTEAFLLQLKLWLELSRNEVDDAQRSLTTVEEFLQRTRLSRDVIDLSEDRCNLLLRKGLYREAESEVARMLSQAEARGNVYLEASACLYLAQVEFRKGAHRKALDAIERALAICEEQGYGTEHAVCLFHAAGIAYGAHEMSRFHGYVLRAEKKATELGLEKSARCFTYLRESVFRTSASSRAFAHLVAMPDLGREVEYYLSCYDIFTEQEFLVGGRTKRVMRASDVRVLLSSRQALLWFSADGLLLYQGRESAETVVLKPGSVLHKTFEKFLENESGLSLANIHAINSESAFHPLRHSEQSKSVIKRLRTELGSAGVDLEFDREGHCYLLKSAVAIERITPFEGRANASIRENEILDFIAREQRATTSELRAHFNLSRQALHVYLKNLVQCGKLKLSRRGPLSSYTLK